MLTAGILASDSVLATLHTGDSVLATLIHTSGGI